MKFFDFLSDTCKYRLFYKENNDYIQSNVINTL